MQLWSFWICALCIHGITDVGCLSVGIVAQLKQQLTSTTHQAHHCRHDTSAHEQDAEWTRCCCCTISADPEWCAHQRSQLSSHSNQCMNHTFQLQSMTHAINYHSNGITKQWYGRRLTETKNQQPLWDSLLSSALTSSTRAVDRFCYPVMRSAYCLTCIAAYGTHDITHWFGGMAETQCRNMNITQLAAVALHYGCNQQCTSNSKCSTMSLPWLLWLFQCSILFVSRDDKSSLLLFIVQCLSSAGERCW